MRPPRRSPAVGPAPSEAPRAEGEAGCQSPRPATDARGLGASLPSPAPLPSLLRVVVAGSEPSDPPAAAGEERRYRWWKPYGCRSAAGVRVDGVQLGAACRARGCIECHPVALREMMTGLDVVELRPGERAYSVRFTSTARVMTRADVADFLRRVRQLMREWEQEHGLGAGWWVAEVVVKPDEGRTRIRCPVRLAAPQAGELDRWRPEAQRVVRETLEDCQSGTACLLCDGTGWLPAVHLHAHAVLFARPFWFGEGPGDPARLPPGCEAWQSFRGGGFADFYRRHGLGNSQAENLRTKGGAAAYITKAARIYLSKVSRDRDHQAEQRAAMVASAIYGRERHRGTHGRAYGVRSRSVNPARDVRLGGKAPPSTVPLLDQAPALLAARDQWRQAARLRQAVAEVTEPEPTPLVVVEAATVGARALEQLSGETFGSPGDPSGDTVATVRPAAGVGGGSTSARWAPDVCLWHDDGTPAGPAPRWGFRAADVWNGAPVVPPWGWWSCATPHGLVIGRGQVACLLADARDTDARTWVTRAATFREEQRRQRRAAKAGGRDTGGPPPPWAAYLRDEAAR